jgi:hypothetical protein
MKSAKQTRDELAEQYDQMDYSSCSDSGVIIGFNKGFDAGREYELERAKVLVEALKFECGNRCAIGINPCNAREALEKYESEGE